MQKEWTVTAMPKRINPRRRPVTMADVQRAKDTATADACRVTLAIFFTALLDKEGMDAEQLQRIWREVEALSESVRGGNFGARAEANREARTTSVAAGDTEAEKTASCVKLQRMDGYYLVDVDGNPHRFTLWETAMQFIREHAGELT